MLIPLIALLYIVLVYFLLTIISRWEKKGSQKKFFPVFIDRESMNN